MATAPGKQNTIVAAGVGNQSAAGLTHSVRALCERVFALRSKDEFESVQKLIAAGSSSHCEELWIRWTQSNHRNISISHRASVARLDSFVGPKT